MAARLLRLSLLLLVLSALLPRGVFAADPSSPAATAEPPGPKASADVEKLLQEASRLADAKQSADSLKVADQALETARQTRDAAAEAFAQQARAKALHDLERNDEALAAWQEASEVWARAGDTPEQIVALVQAGLLLGDDKQNEANRLFLQGLSVGKLPSPRPGAAAQALHESGVAFGKRGLEPVAMEYLGAALALREKLSPESADVVDTLYWLSKYTRNRGVRNTDQKYYNLAREYATKAVALGQRVAPDSFDLMAGLEMLALCDLDAAGDTTAARRHLLDAVRIQKKRAPDGSREEVSLLVDLGQLEMDLTNFTIAHKYMDEAVAMAEKVAPESLQFEAALGNLADLESREGNLLPARELFERVLDMRIKRHANLGVPYENLGNIAVEQYDFGAARDYLEKALEIFKKSYPNTSAIAFVLRDLSNLSYNQGDLVSALEYGQRAAARDREQGMSDSSDFAEDLKVIATALRDQGNATAAADHYERALKVLESGEGMPQGMSDILANLAKLARARHNPTLALEYDHRALRLGQKSCPNSWCVTNVLNDLGELAYEQGDLAESESQLRRTVEIREKNLGPAHPDLARSLNSLAITLAALGKTKDALAASLRAERIGSEHLRLSARTLSERQAMSYESIRASGLDLALTLAADRRSMPSARSEVFDAVIHSRALVFDELAARHRSAYGSGDPEVSQIANQLSSARAQLATLVFRGAGDLSGETYRKLLDDTREKKEKAERALTEKSLAFRRDEARAQIGLKEIAAAVPPRSALVAIVRYNRHDLHKPSRGSPVPAPVPSYAAFVLRAGEHAPSFVSLGSTRDIDRMVAAWRQDIAKQAELADTPPITDRNSRRTGAALRRAIWDPLQPALDNAKEVFVVPDAALHLTSLASLPVGATRYLVETGPLIHYLSTERDLIPTPARHGDGILVVGNPAFDQAGGLMVVASTPSTVSAGSAPALLRGTRSACGSFQTLHFASLPASQQEADDVAALWNRSTLQRPGGSGLLQMTGGGASREAFEQYAPGKRVLHVATHGFFLEGSCESAVERRADASKRNEKVLPAAAENPLLLSGLAFAGANRHASAKADETDGILTAEEIAGMNLEGVDWAVLSACDTGVGEIKVGEGVFGLRRAFQVAGAKTVIMSLWPVEDETTRQWMGTLYREHFLNGNDTGESVRAASLQILRQRRAKHQSTHPFYWGAFIAAGDWH